jgi:hypothetical protein
LEQVDQSQQAEMVAEAEIVFLVLTTLSGVGVAADMQLALGIMVEQAVQVAHLVQTYLAIRV